MSRLSIEIVDSSTRKLVDAVLREDLQPVHLIEVEEAWGPIRLQNARTLLAAHVAQEELPQHWHWNWASKSGNLRLLAYRCIGIECQGEMQGLMMVTNSGHQAKLDPDKGRPILYVEYIESAPWNLAVLTQRPRYSAIGSRLIEAAIRLSLDEGFHGRIGLHSLPRAEKFYRDTCKMTGLGVDPGYQDLPYYEMTREQAAEYLTGGMT